MGERHLERNPETIIDLMNHVMLNLFQHLSSFDPIGKDGQNGSFRFNW